MNSIITNNCPSCQISCSIIVDQVGTNVICPNCTQEFTAYQPYSPDQSPKKYPDHLINPSTLRLYTIEGVGIATFLGSFLAGGFVIAANYRKLGDKHAASNAIIISLMGNLVYFFIIFLILAATPSSIPSVVFWFPQIIIMRKIFKKLQGTITESHIESGGDVESNWKAVGIGALFFFIWWTFFKVVFGVSII